MPPYPEDPPNDESLQPLPSNPDAERDLIGSVLYDEEAFALANVDPSDFYIHRYRWIWEACKSIRDDADHIDEPTLQKYLEKAGRWEDVTAQHSLDDYYNPTLLHVEANARIVRDMAERRRAIEKAGADARRAYDLSTPMPGKPVPFQSRWTMEQLARAEFPEPEGPIPGIIPNGLTILGGRPKRGKSWLMLQAGCTLGIGGRFLDRDLRLGKVLYYALEDRPRRLKDRTAKLGIPSHALIEFELAIKPLHLGGMAEIENAARSGKHSMIVIDTIRRALPGKDFTKDGALFDDFLSQLQTLAQYNHISIVAILHTRKNAAGFDPDPVDDVLGSTGLTASADCVLALYTEQGKKGATLKGRGRDLDDIDLALEFDRDTGCWQSNGESGEAKRREAEKEILDALADLGKAQANSIARTLGKDYSNTHKMIARLWTEGRIKKEVLEGKSFYFLPPEKET